MHVGRKTQKREKSAMSVSLYGNLLFVVIELIMAIVTSSQAVLLDAVYDTQIETLFIVIKGITMTAVTFGLIFNNINLMIHGGHIISFNTVAYFELFACVLGIIVTVYLYIKNKTMQSPLINMEMQGWRMDSVVSFGMACAFLLPMFIPFAWFQKFVPYLDQIITVVLSLIMIPAPIHTIITGFRDLMLIPPEEETIEDIKATVEPIIGIYGHKNL